MIQPKIISNTINLLISKLIPAFLLTLINILFSRNLSQEEYGIYQTVWSFISVFVILSTFGIPRYIMTFGSIYKHDQTQIKKLLFIVFLFTLLPISIYLFFYYDHIDNTNKILCLLLLLSQAFYLIQEANIISLLHNQILVISNIIYAVLLFASHVIILYFVGYSLNYCLEAIIVISIVRNIFVWRLSASHRNQNDNQNILLNKLQLFWFGLNDSLQILTKWFDKIILLLILPPADYAIYFNGTYELPIIGMALTAFQSIITSFSGQTPDDKEKHIALFSSSSLFMSGILFPLFAFAFFYSEQLIELFFSNTYHDSAKLFAITALLLPLRICSYTVLLQLKEKGKTILMGSIIDFVIAILLMIILYPYFKLAGLAMAIVIATYVQASFYLYHICKTYSISINILIPLNKLALRFIIITSSFFLLKHFLTLNLYSLNFITACILAIGFVLFYSNKSIPLKQLIKR